MGALFIESKKGLLLGNVGAGTLPTRNTCRKMLYVFVTKLRRSTSSALIGAASRASAISNNQGAFVFWQVLGKLFSVGSIGYRGWDVSLFIRTGSVYVDHGNLTGLNGFLQFLDADIGKLAGKKTASEE